MSTPLSAPARHTLAWSLAAAVGALLLWLLSGAIMPFAAGAALAYALTPLAGRVERLGASRPAASAVVLLAAGVFALLAILLLVPMVMGQVGALAAVLPTAAVRLRDFAMTELTGLLDALPAEQAGSIREALGSSTATVLSYGAHLLGQLLSSGVALFDTISLLVVTPVVAFYLLKDEARILAVIDEHVPPARRPLVRRIAKEADTALGGFMRGQMAVCLILAAFYATTLIIAGLQYGLTIGIVAGMLTFIPYAGAMIGLGLGAGLALMQFGLSAYTGAVVAIFLVAQALEGNWLSPKLVGESAGLHPVWSMFALIAGSSVLGFTGLLVAVPAAAVIAVLCRHGAAAYRASDLYGRGIEPPAA